ncbi:TPA: ShlB/FhaC/HecB family hemolysin secretion/activation protein [Klebsiella aerogenes]|jgi:Hemolysin activation/secretion protein|uniref:ShlB/FhaC/HecB family hemolysin secretion/activation protein n=1 Tax=Klebsiella aerogenes TaxID=548 RepID=UPI0007B33569|nr:ShlB/FhaC/HecB family hemolysin secretion/activation protein [Klebsiella aerogenes]KZQ93797.1 peptide ABC transporter permease [Klebsiella aerogenes]MDY0844850.1 ShlB/FhaC/HecB family hemolysin secretion/activation protein [Klebsiella aerogenes]WPS32162.1 ShlB/FhaC/HecB family hemolysin secretion/activation protein [Klebsiella aerogenes]HBV6394693.1 ShlB/FhaC/HecB family hemolysin secretion/activation protein [Klebsiella aerogenes]HCM7228073.1 ShlB/FhaC/HecB family hemolysin secretion/activ
MDIRHTLIITSLFLVALPVAAADVQLGRLIKEQQSNDNASLQDRKIEQKDVYSDATTKKYTDSTFPQETPCFQINELILSDDFLDNNELKKIENQVVGQCLGMNGLKKAAVLFQDYYINAGYITTRVEIPTQDLSTKKLKLTVVPGRISEIVVAGNDISKWILPFSVGDILNIRDLEQGLENIQRTPEVDVKINILPGSENGSSKVVINTQRKKKWSLRASYNNFGDQSTGSELIGGTSYLYNVTGLSDLFYLAGTGSQTGGYKNVSTYYSVPFGYYDLSLYYSKSKSHQGIDIGAYTFDYIGKTEYFSLKGNRMLYRNVNSKLSASAELIRRKYDYTLGGTELVLQKRDMGNVRLGVNYKRNFTGAALDSTVTWQRFTKAFGGTDTPDMRTGTVSKESQIVNLNVNYVKWLTMLPVNAYYELNFGAQYSPDNLTLQDQFTIGDRWSVRGFQNSDGIYGNKGFFLQNTLNAVTGYKGLIPYIGADYGQIIGKLPSQNLSGKKIMGGILGVKGAVRALEYDASVSAPFIYPNNLDVDEYKLNFNFAYQI